MTSKVSPEELKLYYSLAYLRFLNKLGNIAWTMNIVELLTPINASNEMEKFLVKAKGSEYASPVFTSPEFQYNTELLCSVAQKQNQVLELIEILPSVIATLSTEEPGRVLGEIVANRCLEIYRITLIAQSILDGNDTLTSSLLQSIYGVPSDAVVTQACNYASDLAHGFKAERHDTPELKARRLALKKIQLNSEQIRDYFVWAVQWLGLDNSRPIIVDPLATSIDVRDKSSKGPVIVIPSNRRLSAAKLAELIRHEIDRHLGASIRVEEFLPNLGNRNNKPADETLYEGDAVRADTDTKQLLGERAAPYQEPYYITAMSMIQNAGLSFGELASSLYGLILPTVTSEDKALDKAWKICLRVTRGSSGKSRHYMFTKDRAYFEGRILANQLCEEGLENALQFATISVSDLELLKPVVDFGENAGHLTQSRALVEQFCDKVLAEHAE